MSKWIFYLIFELAMNQYYEEEWSNIDKLLLISRRFFILLFIIIVIRVLLFKIIWINKTNDWNEQVKEVIANHTGKNIKKQVKKEKINITQEPEIENLWKHYEKINNEIYYKWKKLDFVDANKFTVIDQRGRYYAQWIVVNSDNLLQMFADYDTRVLMMKQVDNIIENEKNATKELKSASENGMYKMENQYNTLSQFDRNDRYEMTDQQRAKFAIMFLYVKIAKSMSNSEISMEVALKQLKEFLEKFDENDLKKEISQKKITKIRWNIGMDDYCIYVNWKMYACFLDKIFVQ